MLSAYLTIYFSMYVKNGWKKFLENFSGVLLVSVFCMSEILFVVIYVCVYVVV
jgi:hypothetical protein